MNPIFFTVGLIPFYISVTVPIQLGWSLTAEGVISVDLNAMASVIIIFHEFSTIAGLHSIWNYIF
jgi:hypothetical protein